ncbi:hypothetical protein HAX54_024353 [Datura stramonium]|uniref:Uncharacterized protein n=1 Tax=Datura stramonium TaxID=4076 RepID=A0ABS8S5J6_DATST|nr:hypothetical protein [Datura stramonium]
MERTTKDEITTQNEKAAICKEKRPISEIYEFKMLTPEEVLSSKIEALYFEPRFPINFEQGGMSECDELKEEEEMLPTEKQENLEKLRAEVRKGKRPISELYELKPIVPTFSNFERGGTSENEMKEEDEFDYDQDLAILKFMNDYYFDHGGVIPCPYSEKFIDDIKALIPNLKIHGQALVTKILRLHHYFLTVLEIAAILGFMYH